ncbi:DUF6766 family protein [Saccharothrix longispora]|uniref:DUF6766 family protein n=1 Tax=Saccharothrix longispora TaxID=33920 RepID=UPI0031E845AF
MAGEEACLGRGAFLGSWGAQSIAGRSAYNNEQLVIFQDTVTWSEYPALPDFWNRSLQNRQSEFLAIGSIVVFSVHLRQRGSSQSKPVGSPHTNIDGNGWSTARGRAPSRWFPSFRGGGPARGLPTPATDPPARRQGERLPATPVASSANARRRSTGRHEGRPVSSRPRGGATEVAGGCWLDPRPAPPRAGAREVPGSFGCKRRPSSTTGWPQRSINRRPGRRARPSTDLAAPPRRGRRPGAL